MIKIYQTRTGFPCGNCFEACIASLLEIPLDLVPDLHDWKGEKIEITAGDPPAKYEQTILNWLHPIGLSLEQISVSKYSIFKLPYGHELMIGGMNPDDVPHCVVGECRNGELVITHNPNPDNRRLKSIESMYHFVSLKPQLNGMRLL